MTTFQIVETVFAIAIILILLVIGLTHIQYMRFQSAMKVGDLCEFFIEEERATGVIQKIKDDQVTISTGSIKECIRNKRDVYPI